jgi:hypothetical protein
LLLPPLHDVTVIGHNHSGSLDTRGLFGAPEGRLHQILDVNNLAIADGEQAAVSRYHWEAVESAAVDV